MVKIRDIFEDDDNVIRGPWTKPVKQNPIGINLKKPTDVSKIKKIPMHQAIGGEYGKLYEAGIRFVEKPSYWTEVFRQKLGASLIPDIELILKRPLNEYYGSRLFVDNYNEYMPQSKVNFNKLKNNEETFILTLLNSDIHNEKDIPFELLDKNSFNFLCNRTGANTYIRLWCYIDSNK